MSRVLGTVARLQVQRCRLKPGPRGTRVYDPSPLLEVAALEVGPRGAVGHLDGTAVLDVHHADHPDTRNRRLGNGLSLLPRAAADRLVQRYGEHLAGGVPGESVLLETDGPLSERDLAGELLLDTVAGPPLVLFDVVAASPCLEFARFALGREAGAVDDEVLLAMDDLDGGARGFYCRVRGSGTVVPGARLCAA